MVRSKKIRIYPAAEFRANFRRYLGLSRFWYNKAVEHLKQPGTKASLYDVRKIQETVQEDWAFNCPQRIREHSISDACKAVSNAKQKYKKTGELQEIKFRRRRDPAQGFGLDRISLGQNFLFSRKGFRSKFHPSEDLPDRSEVLEGLRVVLESDRWFLILPQRRPVKVPENQRNGTVALDPGVRTFVSLNVPTSHG